MAVVITAIQLSFDVDSQSNGSRMVLVTTAITAEACLKKWQNCFRRGHSAGVIYSKCVPVLLYGLEACLLNISDFRSLDFVTDRFFMKLFKTNNSASDSAPDTGAL